MLLSSTLQKLRSVGLSGPEHVSSSSPPSSSYESVRTASIFSRTAWEGGYGVSASRKLRSTPARRGYTDLAGLEGSGVVEPSQLAGEVINNAGAASVTPLTSSMVDLSGASVAKASDTHNGGKVDMSPSSSAGSFSSPNKPSKPSHSSPIALSISTGLDASGHRVLTSRRRQSVPSSPTKCRKIKTAFGVGDEDESLASSASTVSALQDRTTAINTPRTTFSANLASLSSTGYTAEPASSPSSAADQLDQALSSEATGRLHPVHRSRSCREHIPIKTFTPPPPLVTTPSARLSTLSVLTRSSTLTSSSASSSPHQRQGSLSRSNSRRHSFARRSTLKRFSLPIPNTPSLPLPPLSPTISSTAALERRYSERIASDRNGRLERHASHASSSGTSASSPSIPPTPTDGSPLLSSPASYFAPAFSAYPATPSEVQANTADPPPVKPARVSLVSFELPPSPRLSLERTSTRVSASPTAHWGRHTRSLSEGHAVGGEWAVMPAFSYLAEEEKHLTVSFAFTHSPHSPRALGALTRLSVRMQVTNPDISTDRPGSPASSHHTYHSLPLCAPYDSASMPYTAGGVDFFIPAHEIGIAC
ncbi:hypothetical protein JCM10908_002507 [Rhodotorula pacifica]|uniref:uncharacterized protein n=1 Tax=Rhodotorula pacifica TaxID=1495444 RepID=UPI00317761AC